MGIKDIFSQAVKELWKKDGAEDNTDAIVFGDINASTIAVTDGAIIQGYVNTTFLSKEDKLTIQIAFLRMSGYNGYEIAEKTGLTQKAVNLRMVRLRKKLKKFFEA